MHGRWIERFLFCVAKTPVAIMQQARGRQDCCARRQEEKSGGAVHGEKVRIVVDKVSSVKRSVNVKRGVNKGSSDSSAEVPNYCGSRKSRSVFKQPCE